MKTKNKLTFGKNGINWLIAAKDCFIIERNMNLLHYKNYPNYQSGIKAKEWSERLLKSSEKVKKLINELRKELTTS